MQDALEYLQTFKFTKPQLDYLRYQGDKEIVEWRCRTRSRDSSIISPRWI